MIVSVILIALGVCIYWFNFGWTLTLDISLPLYASAFFVVMGLILAIKRRD